MADKMTRVEILNMIKEECAENEVIVNFCDKEIAAQGVKAEKAKARAAAKRAEGDELRAAVASVLTDKPMIAEEVLAAMPETEGLTRAKVVARLTQLVKNGEAEKQDIEVVDGDNKKRKIKGYKLI